LLNIVFSTFFSVQAFVIILGNSDCYFWTSGRPNKWY